MRRVAALALVGLVAGLAATAASASTPGIDVTTPTEGEVLPGPTARVTIRFSASCDTQGTKYVVAAVYGSGGRLAASSGTVFDLSSPLTLVVTLPRGSESEQYTLKVELHCGSEVRQAGERHFTVTRGNCDPTLLAKAEREYAVAESFTKAGSRELTESGATIRDFLVDYGKESAEIGAEKLTALDMLKGLSEEAFEAAEVTALYVAIGVTIEEITLKLIPTLTAAHRLDKEARADFARADRYVARGKQDLDRALAQGPCLGPLEKRLDDLLGEDRVEERAQALIDSWEHGQAVYRDPATGDVYDESGALKRARQIISSGSHRTQSAASARQSRKVFATGKQIKAAISQLNRAQADHWHAKRRLEAYQRLVDRVARRLRAVLA